MGEAIGDMAVRLANILADCLAPTNEHGRCFICYNGPEPD
jgi:hypothetical protein